MPARPQVPTDQAAPTGQVPTTQRPSARTVARVFARDATCTFPGCSVPAFRCDLDHVVAPRPGDESGNGAHNLVALCRRHRVLRARDGWRPALLGDGTVRWTGPSGHTYERPAPRRGA
ncbi:HNH endonuclease signature motif containing protein [Cellulosimicrobium arenosum]|uniref:HNH endonuclease n=1 Tax=Cellulosimicrobium arenosum TaxID=2708133 RepID=A0A927IZM1_9MICO|nr:HNH endonuclease signature motif containing protein [Cellulosimicrobium arenosum]MBD8078774.1 HNH endonuclease [Cellulosimicrobium arenosum]